MSRIHLQFWVSVLLYKLDHGLLEKWRKALEIDQRMQPEVSKQVGKRWP
jgi:hypothetical protein